VRLDLLPELARQYNPQVKAAIWRLMSLLEEDERLLTSQTAQTWNRVARMVTLDFAVIHLPSLLALPSGLQKRTLRYALGKLAADQEITSAQVENLLALAKAQRSGGQINFSSCQVARAGQELHLWRRLPPPQGAVTFLSAPGEWHTPQGWRFLIDLKPSPADGPKTPAPGAVFLDAGHVSLPLAIRYFQPGDRFWPHGGPGSRKLKDFFIDSRIPRWLRPHIPLVESSGRIIWVVGLRSANPPKVTSDTKRVLSLEVAPANPYTARVWETLLAWLYQANSGSSASAEEAETEPPSPTTNFFP
jgi:tRNA(Ile)-lysidine synthase